MLTSSYQHILCAVDFSEPSRQALDAALDLTRRFGAALTLVHVYEVPPLGYPDAYPGSALCTKLAQAAEQQLAGWKRDAEARAGRQVDTVVLEGKSWSRIVELARARHADLIMVGTHGRNWFQHALIGSVAENVVRHASCPVLVARAVRA